MSEETTETEAFEAPVQEPVAEAEVQTPETPEVETEDPPQENKGKERLQARFSELTSRIRTAEQDAEYWRAQALQQQRAEPEPSQEYVDPYSPEAIQAEVQRVLATERQKAAQESAQHAQAQKNQAVISKLFDSGLEGAQLIASGADIPFTPAMIDAVHASDNGAQVADHLGRNPSEASRIAALPPHMQGYELAKLESRLASQPKLTSAPPPPPTVGGRGAPATGLRDDLPIDDWMRLERDRQAKRR